jgi:hypothetical protein
MKIKKYILKTLGLFTLVLSMLCLNSCEGKDSDDLLPISILSIKANGAPLVDGAINIPVNSVFEVAFSSEIMPSKFEGLVSLSAGSTMVPFTVVYSNLSSKATITTSQLEAEILYTLSISSGEIGSNGALLQNSTSISFSTNIGKTPCTSATNDCIQSLQVPNNSGVQFNLDMYSNYDFIDDTQFVYNSITQVVIVVHGLQRNANDYFSYMTSSLQSLNMQENTLLISPFFKDNTAAASNDLYWDTRWREGANSGNATASISSFMVIDALIEKIVSSGNFPDLSTVFITGHSSGAAFVQHYALANKAENTYSNLKFEYIVANNQYFYYPDGLRYNESSQQFETPSTCLGYTFWPYGFEFSAPYLDGIAQSVLTEQQVTRSTTYLLGSNDTSTTGSLNTADCQATLLGSNRLKRGENMYLYMQTYFGATNKHQKIIVNNVGHDGNAMYNSTEFKQYLTDNQ